MYKLFFYKKLASKNNIYRNYLKYIFKYKRQFTEMNDIFFNINMKSHIDIFRKKCFNTI